MPKNIVVLSDGTGQEGGKGADRNTNVYKLFTMLEDRTARQVVFYDPGLGTGWRKLTGNAVGAGISRNVREAYRFIFDHYEAGDRIFLVGFSRGATTVRSLAGFIDHFGILPRSRPDLIKRAYKIYKTRAPLSPRWARRRIAKYAKGSWLQRVRKRLTGQAEYFDLRTQQGLARAVVPVAASGADADESGVTAHLAALQAEAGAENARAALLIGKAIEDRTKATTEHTQDAEGFAARLLDLHCPGWSDDAKDPKCPEGFPANPALFMKAFRLETRGREFIAASYSYPTDIQFLGCFDTVAALYRIPILQYKFHDLSLTRSVKNAYHALAIHDPRKPFKPAIWEKTYPDQTVSQVWFTGMHTDVGGGYRERGLADVPLVWMLRKANQCGLLLDPGDVSMIEDPLDLMHNSRGTPATSLLYRTVDRFSPPDPGGPPRKPIVIHESALVRAMASEIAEDTRERWWKKAARKSVPVEAYRRHLQQGLGADPIEFYRASLEGGHEQVEPWERYDQDELIAAQEQRWEAWVRDTTQASPRHFSTERRRILTWFDEALAGTEHEHTAGLRVWDLASGDEVRALTGEAGVVDATVTPDRIVSAATDGTLTVWDLATGAELLTLAGHAGVVGVAATPDRIVSASTDGTLKVWDLATGAELRTLAGHTGEVLAVALTADGRRVVSASYDTTLKVWDLETGAQLRQLAGHTGPVFGVALSPGDRRVVSCSQDETVRVWDLETGAELRKLAGHAEPVFAVAVSPDGTRVVSGSTDRTVRVWDLETGSELEALVGHVGWVSGVAVTPDGSKVISASYDKTLKVWDLATGAEVRTLTGHSGEVSGVSVTADGTRVVSSALEISLLNRLNASGHNLLPGQSGKVQLRDHRARLSYDAKTALLVVDVQNDFADPSGSLYVPGGEQVVDLINAEIERARAAKALVVYTQDWHPAVTHHFNQWPVHCVQNSKGSEFHPNLTVDPDLLAGRDVPGLALIRKGSNGEDGYSGFSMQHPLTMDTISTGLNSLLRDQGIDTVFIAGLALDYTVKWTALEARREKFTTVVLRDATRAIGPESGRQAVTELAKAGVEIRGGAPGVG